MHLFCEVFTISRPSRLKCLGVSVISVMKMVQVTLDLDIINFKMFKNKSRRSKALSAAIGLTVYIRVPTRS